MKKVNYRVFFPLFATLVLVSAPSGAQIFAPKLEKKEIVEEKPAPKRKMPVVPQRASKKTELPQSPKASENEFQKLLAEIKSSNAAVLAAVEQNRTAHTAPKVVLLTEEQLAQKTALKSKLTGVDKQINALDKAIEGGLDPAVVADTKSLLNNKRAEIQSGLEAIQPISQPSEKERASSTMERLVSAMMELEKSMETKDRKPAELAAPSPSRERKTIGISVELGLSSAYLFRGLNMLQSKSQHDQHAILAPSLYYAFGDSGFGIGYWSAYQIGGGNQEDTVAGGLSHEQDLYLNWETSLSDRCSISATLFYYSYPFADEKVAGTAMPSYLEPSVGLSFAGPVDLSMGVAYFAGLQKELQDYSYLYFNPTIGKSIQLNDRVGASLGFGFGYKAFNVGADKISDNMFDLSFDCTLPMSFEGGLSLTPGLHIAWTNMDEIRRGDEYVIWFSLATGFEL